MNTEAWERLGYFEREEHSHLYDVYEVDVVQKIQKKS